MSENGKSKTAFLETGNGNFIEMYTRRWEEIQRGVPVTTHKRIRFETQGISLPSGGEIAYEWFGG